MRVLQRVVGVLAVLLGLAGFVLCVAGIVAGWVYQKPLTERTTTVFGRVERPLDVAVRNLRQVNTSLERARANLKTIQETHGPAAPPPTETNFFRRMAVRAAAKELSPQIGDVRQTLSTVADAAVVLNSVLDDVHDLPGGPLPSLDRKKLAEIRDRLSGIDSSAQELDAMLSDGPSGGVGEKASGMNEALQRILAVTGEYETKAADVQGQVKDLKSRILYWLDVGPAVLTAVLAWVALSQLCILSRGWSWLRRPAAVA